MIKTFYHSLTDLHFYRDLMQRSLSSGIKYFLLTYTLISLVFSLVFSFILLPPFLSITQSTLSYLVDQFPPETDLIIANGQMSLTPENLAPLYLTLPNEIDLEPLKFLAVIYPATPAADVELYQSAFLLTSDSISLYPFDSASPTITKWPIDDFNLSLNRGKLESYLTQVQNFSPILKRYAPLISPFLFWFFFIITRLFMALFYALPLTLIGLSTPNSYRYSHYLNLCLHTIILADAITFLVSLIYRLPMANLLSLAYLGINLIVFFSLNRKSSKEPTA